MKKEAKAVRRRKDYGNAVVRLALSHEEVCGVTGLGDQTVRRLRAQGDLPALTIGRRVLYRVADVENFLAERAAAGNAS
jgi:excisionase family DNA binding protein